MYRYQPDHVYARLVGVVGCYPIVLVYGDEFVLAAPYYNLDRNGVPTFETGTPIAGARAIAKPDIDGTCLIAVPFAAIRDGLSEGEFEDIAAAEDADDALLVRAR